MDMNQDIFLLSNLLNINYTRLLNLRTMIHNYECGITCNYSLVISYYSDIISTVKSRFYIKSDSVVIIDLLSNESIPEIMYYLIRIILEY